jgi:HEAT repeat protein
MLMKITFNNSMMTRTHWHERFEQPQVRNVPGATIRKLVEKIDHPHKTTRVRATRRLVSFGADTVGKLIDALEDEKRCVAACVLLEQILRQLKREGKTIADEDMDNLVTKVLDEKTGISGWIIEFLKRIDTPRAHRALYELLSVDEHHDYTTTTVCIQVLGREIAEGKYRR